MAPFQHASMLINRDLKENPTWELAAVFTVPHVVPAPKQSIIHTNGKQGANVQVLQMACPIYRVLEKDKASMPKAPQGVDEKGNVVIGVDNPLPPKG